MKPLHLEIDLPERVIKNRKFELFGSTEPLYDAEMAHSDRQLVFFQRPVSQVMAYSDTVKTFNHTNVVMCGQLQMPLYFSLYNISVAIEDVDPNCDIVKEILEHGKLKFTHGSGKPCYEETLRRVPRVPITQFPEQFVRDAKEDVLKYLAAVDPFYPPATFSPEQCRTIAPGYYFQAQINFDQSVEALKLKPLFRVFLNGIRWEPERNDR